MRTEFKLGKVMIACKIKMGNLVALAILLANSACVIVTWDQYKLVESKPSSNEVFIPNVYIKKNYQISEYLVARLEDHMAPHHLVLQFMDQTYQKKHEGYSEVTLNKLRIIFADGTEVNCIHPETPEHLRGAKIPNNSLYKPNIIHHVIKKQKNLRLNMAGSSVKEDGRSLSFELNQSYEYHRRLRVYPKFYDYLR